MARRRIGLSVYSAILMGIVACIDSDARPEATIRNSEPGLIASDFEAPERGAPIYEEIGIASWYGRWHQGRLTASGQPFDMNKLTAAHPTLPLNTRARVTNMENGKSIEVRVNDRGPYVKGRAIDLSAKAAEKLGMMKQGLSVVRIEVLPRQTASSASD